MVEGGEHDLPLEFLIPPPDTADKHLSAHQPSDDTADILMSSHPSIGMSSDLSVSCYLTFFLIIKPIVRWTNLWYLDKMF